MTDRLAELGALQYAVENLSTAGTNPNRLGLAGYIHAAYIEYQVWAAANPGVNPNRLSARGRLYGYFHDYGFSPLNLFSAGEVGAWYDPSDLSTMFQDRAGTTPVTADGQTVGKILDKSGRGNHATAPSDAARPLYKTDGTYHWLQFDGVDDSLSTAEIDVTGTDKMSMFIGSRVIGITNQMPCSFGSAGNGRADILYLSGASPVARATLLGGSGGLAQISTPSAGSSPISLVNSAFFDIAGSTATDEIKIRQNGALGTQTVITEGPAGTGNFGNYKIGVGDTGSGVSTFPLNGNIYSLIIRGALSTTQEITDTETWVNSKCGAF